MNDAALAILDALAKQKRDDANAAIRTTLEAQDYLVRRRAATLLAAAKTDGESKWGKQRKSIDPSIPTRATV